MIFIIRLLYSIHASAINTSACYYNKTCKYVLAIVMGGVEYRVYHIVLETLEDCIHCWYLSYLLLLIRADYVL